MILLTYWSYGHAQINKCMYVEVEFLNTNGKQTKKNSYNNNLLFLLRTDDFLLLKLKMDNGKRPYVARNI